MKKGSKREVKKRMAVVLASTLVGAASMPSFATTGELHNEDMLDTVAVSNVESKQTTSSAIQITTKATPAQNTTYKYNFGNLDEAKNLGIPVDGSKINTLVTTDGLLTIVGNGNMGHNKDKHGLIVKNGNSFEVPVAGNAIITFELCEYGNGGTITAAAATGNGKFSDNINLKVGKDGETATIKYVGDPTTLIFTVNGSGYMHSMTVENTSEALDLTPWREKSFSIEIGNTQVDVKGAALKGDKADISVTNGEAYYAQSEEAYISMDLKGSKLTNDLLKNNSTADVESVTVNGEGNVVVSFADKSSNPSTYLIKVQDTSQFETPGVTDVYSFNFNSDTSIPHEFTGSNPITDSYTTDNGILTLSKGTSNKSPYWHDPTHGLALYDGNTFDIVVAGDAEITFGVCKQGKGGTLSVTNLAADGQGSFDNDQMGPSTCNDTITYTYTGSATTLRFSLANSGEAYLHNLKVVNKGKVTGSDVANEQPAMPQEIDTTDSLSVTPTGQRLQVVHSNGAADISSLNNVGYYVFEPSQDTYAIEADVQVKMLASGSKNGLFIGMFDDKAQVTQIATVGFRGDGLARNMFTKPDTANVSGGGIDATYNQNEILHVRIEKRADGWYSEFTQGNNETQSKLYKFTDTELLKKNGADTNVRFGFVFSNVQATIKNLMVTDKSGKILYDQTDCYEAIGTAPVITGVNTPIVSNDRTTISVNWEGESALEDATYQVELSTDGGQTYTILSREVTEKNYTAPVSVTGDYVFKVSGVCGDQSTGFVLSPAVNVVAPLTKPVLTAESGDGAITLNWQVVKEADQYEIYRRSAEATGYTLLDTVAETTYVDTKVTNEEPYYYYVIAKSANNESNPSNALLMVPSAGRTGKYVYEDEAAEIFVTKKSYDTVYKNEATLEGIIDEAGSLALEVNGVVQETVTLGKKEAFSFKVALEEGRNDVNLLFTDKEGRVTRKTFNFVYLTHYDIVVDGSYTGVDGEMDATTNAKVYRTVQAAVDSVAADNKARVVILVKEGDYTEHLTITSPYITLIGEDREKVNINFYDKVLSPEGGDTDKRCAVYVKESATSFSAENLTFENTYEYLGNGSNESADALRVDADQSTFINVKLLGYQDTLNASKNKQYYYKCYITGNVDYIYGSAQALFEDCELVFRYNATKNSGYITAPKTDANKTYGYIFNNCVVYAEEGCNGSKYLLARPWGPDGAATFINTYMGSIVNKTNAYSDMNGDSYLDARFSEYYSYGPGYAITSKRPQISKAQAEQMLTADFLGWAPENVSKELAKNHFIGSVVTEEEEKFVESEYSSEAADPDATDDTGLGAYTLEGYGNKVTGGGVLLETASNYYKVDSAEAFLDALATIKKSGKPSVIELTADINLGSIELGSALSTYSNLVKAVSKAPLLHPTLLQTGVSTLYLKDMSNLTIYSKNGAAIKHACIDISNSSNIMIRNVVFDELWEWDEATSGDYDRNDWDYVTIQNGSHDIWIDHCTFYKSYDGIVDVKKADSNNKTNVTISWSKFLPGSETSFFDEMMDMLEANPDQYPYYTKLMTDYDMTKEQIRSYASMQKKTHLIGASDTEANMANLNITLANNYYKNSMDRMPRMRQGDAHVYNCILDAADNFTLKSSMTNEEASMKVVSKGPTSTINGSVLLENTYIDGILHPLTSGTTSNPNAGGYINAINSIYYLDGVEQELVVESLSTLDGSALDATQFIAQLPYSNYKLYDVNQLHTKVLPYTGAGSVDMNSIQWQKTTYNDVAVDEEVAKEYKVTLDYQGATSNNTVESIQVLQGKAYGNLPTPRKSGYAFLGWYTAVTGGEKVLPTTIVTEDTMHTLYARWAVISTDDSSDDSTDNSTNNNQGGTTSTPEVSKPETSKPDTSVIEQFTDIRENHWAQEAINYVVQQGILKGMGEGKFAPSTTMTRGMFAVVLHRLAGEVEVTGNNEFKDVQSGTWYENAVVWMTEQGIAKGMGEGKFAPNAAVTREQMAVMLYNYVNAMGIKLPQEIESSRFNDQENISSWATEAMQMMQKAGIIQGDHQGNCNPKGDITRAEVAVMLQRLMEIL